MVVEVLLGEVDIDLDRTLVIVEIEVILLIVVDHVQDIQGPDHEQDRDLTHIPTLIVMITQTIDVLIDPGNTTGMILKCFGVKYFLFRSARSHRSGRSHRSRRTSAHSRKSVSRSRPDLTDISPLSPDKPDEVINDSSMMRLPVKAQEPERVILQKGKHSKESYGIRLGTRIFIQDVQPNSLADQRGLKKGDTVLEINGTGCDNKTVNEAIQLISSGKGKC